MYHHTENSAHFHLEQLFLFVHICINLFAYYGGFPVGSDGKEASCNVEDPGLIPGLGRSPGERNDYPLQYSCPENPTEESGGLLPMGLQRV